MRANADLTLTGSRVMLVPYRTEHVEVYHGWMVSRTPLQTPGCQLFSLQLGFHP